MEVRPCRTAGESGRLLHVWRIHKGRSVSPNAKVLYVTDDADDLPRPQLIDRIRIIAEENLLADGIFIGEEFACQRLIHHDDPRAALGVMFIQIATLPQWNLQSLEHVRAYLAIAGLRAIFGRRSRVAEDRKRVKLRAAARRQCTDYCGGLDAGLSANFFQHALIERRDRRHRFFHVPARHSLDLPPSGSCISMVIKWV